MTKLNKWGIYPNFNIKDAHIAMQKVSKRCAKFSVVPKNTRSITLHRKADKAFDFIGKKLTHTIKGSYTIGTSKKRKILLTQGFIIEVEKKA